MLRIVDEMIGKDDSRNTIYRIVYDRVSVDMYLFKAPAVDT